MYKEEVFNILRQAFWGAKYSNSSNYFKMDFLRSQTQPTWFLILEISNTLLDIFCLALYSTFYSLAPLAPLASLVSSAIVLFHILYSLFLISLIRFIISLQSTFSNFALICVTFLIHKPSLMQYKCYWYKHWYHNYWEGVVGWGDRSSNLYQRGV